MSLESGKALKALALAIKTMSQPSSADPHIENSKSSAKKLNSLLKSGLWEDTDLLAVIPVATVASLLIDVVNCTERIAESVYELASAAKFKSVDATVSPDKSELGQRENAKPKDVVAHVVITVSDESTPGASENGNSSNTAAGRHNL